MNNRAGPYKVCRNPEPAPSRSRKWVCMDMRDKTVVSTHYFRKNAVSVAALSNSVARKYGGLHNDVR